MDNVPLAERLRPESLATVVGQLHLVGNGQIIHEIVERKAPTSLILWGPPGSGKTTLARIIARETGAEFIELSAVTAGKADVVKVVERAKTIRKAFEAWERGLGVDAMQGKDDARNEPYRSYGEGAQQSLTLQSATRSGRVSGSARKQDAPPKSTILFVDEIHRFNKAQQDAFLPHVESGVITLIGATTENPSFEVINPLLSRSRVLVLEPLSKSEVTAIVKRAAKVEKLSAKKLPTRSIDLIAELSGGDARVALNILELALQLAGSKTITTELVETAAQTKVPGYDKKGENHYNVISAFIKSLRGSDATAALYYMARMLQAGEDPKFVARRMVVFASEDIGLAAPAALNLAVSTFLAVERIGMPECEYNLYHCATVLAKAPKSREVTGAMGRAKAAARDFPDLPVPLHLRNAPTKLMKDLGYNQGYEWQAGFKDDRGFLPDELKNTDFFK
jgi:putative ATPase